MFIRPVEAYENYGAARNQMEEPMKLLIQRVLSASVTVEDEIVGSIGKGLLVFVGVGGEDTHAVADQYLKKLLSLRIFEDAQGKTNLSLADVEGELLFVSQFTLYADCRKGNRPGFFKAGPPGLAQELYEYMIDQARRVVPVVESGRFVADMKVSLVNDGPFTIIMDENTFC